MTTNTICENAYYTVFLRIHLGADHGAKTIVRKGTFLKKHSSSKQTYRAAVLDILAFLGIHTIEEVKHNPLTKSFEKKYPRCFAFLEETGKW